jgi:hypothetical protein
LKEAPARDLLSDHDEYNALWRLRHDKQKRRDLRAKVDAGLAEGGTRIGKWVADLDVQDLQRLDERAKAGTTENDRQARP